MASAATPASAGTPASFIKELRGKAVTARLTTGVDYKGILVVIDGYMNVALENCEEWQDNQLKGKYGDAFLRGNNVLYIAADKQ